jgi:hypothetical protein
MRTRTYDPFGWRIAELADPELNPLRRTELLDDLVAAEAEELAEGRRHLTIVHGEPTDIVAAEALDDFYDAVAAIARTAEWSRLSGGTDYLTITLAGPRRDEMLATMAELGHRSAPDHWHLLATPSPM